MKKILLGLFLILGVVSFALPSYIDGQKVKKAGYEVTDDREYSFRIIKEKSNGEGTLILYYIDRAGNSSAKEMSEVSIQTAPEGIRYLSSTENKVAYINKFTDDQGSGIYSFVGKKSKKKNCYLVIMHFSNKQLSNSELTKVVENIINEGESFLK